jgi:hypothetical protein
MSATETFDAKSPALIARLMADFSLTEIQAAGILGNLGHESGLQAVQEKHPTSGRGGFGWAQWTGPRRVAFEAFCARTNQDARSDGANYGYLWRELSGHQPGFDYRKAITFLRKADTLSKAVRTFERHYEAAGVKAYASRDKWAVRALAAYRRASGSDAVKRIQERLIVLGHDLRPDGIIGPMTLAAITAALGA